MFLFLKAPPPGEASVQERWGGLQEPQYLQVWGGRQGVPAPHSVAAATALGVPKGLYGEGGASSETPRIKLPSEGVREGGEGAAGVQLSSGESESYRPVEGEEGG